MGAEEVPLGMAEPEALEVPAEAVPDAPEVPPEDVPEARASIWATSFSAILESAPIWESQRSSFASRWAFLAVVWA